MVAQASSPGFWRLWKQGLFVLLRVYFLAFVFYYIVYVFPIYEYLVDHVEPPAGQILGVVFVLGTFALLGLLLPLMAAAMFPNSKSERRQLLAEIELRIDALADSVGLQWESYYLSKVNELLAHGKSLEARRCYHDHSGAPWDEVDQALLDWPTTALKEKLRILEVTVSRVRDIRV
jgi:hypothetical protein